MKLEAVKREREQRAWRHRQHHASDYYRGDDFEDNQEGHPFRTMGTTRLKDRLSLAGGPTLQAAPGTRGDSVQCTQTYQVCNAVAFQRPLMNSREQTEDSRAPCPRIKSSAPGATIRDSTIGSDARQLDIYAQTPKRKVLPVFQNQPEHRDNTVMMPRQSTFPQRNPPYREPRAAAQRRATTLPVDTTQLLPLKHGSMAMTNFECNDQSKWRYSRPQTFERTSDELPETFLLQNAPSTSDNNASRQTHKPPSRSYGLSSRSLLNVNLPSIMSKKNKSTVHVQEIEIDNSGEEEEMRRRAAARPATANTHSRQRSFPSDLLADSFARFRKEEREKAKAKSREAALVQSKDLVGARERRRETFMGFFKRS